MLYQLEFRPYQRPFQRALSTSHGNWEIREGVILRLRDRTGRIGYGEIAPIPWFGSETLNQALNFCAQLGNEITTENIFSIPSQLPACQFGFESAWETLNKEAEPLATQEAEPPATRSQAEPGNEGDTGSQAQPGNNLYEALPRVNGKTLRFSGLLPTGEAALQAWQPLWEQGYRTFKWKIAVASIEDELNIFKQLIETIPTEVKLRLDANGGLNWESANEWLKMCDRFHIEFLEQPLPVDKFDAMLELSRCYFTPLALDESVANIHQLQACYQKGWQSIFVIKPCIAGSPQKLREFCHINDIDLVFSSVFETAIGRQFALQLAAELARPDRAIGFGVDRWFNDDEETWLNSLWNNH